jgi:hypothetical protein
MKEEHTPHRPFQKRSTTYPRKDAKTAKETKTIVALRHVWGEKRGLQRGFSQKKDRICGIGALLGEDYRHV